MKANNKPRKDLTSEARPIARASAGVDLARELKSSDDILIQAWLHPSGRRDSTHTARAYRRHITRLRTFLGGKRLGLVTLLDLQAWYDTLKGAPRSRAQALAAVKSLFRYAQENGAFPFNVAGTLAIKRPPNDVIKHIPTEAEVLTLLGGARRRKRDHVLLTLMYASGMRVSEISGLKWEDAVAARDGGVVFVFEGKGGSARNVRVSAATWALVQTLRHDKGASRTWIFAGGRRRKTDGALTTRRIEVIVRATARRAGLERRITPHSLRHACASHVLARGGNLALVREQLGHRTLETTTLYVHALEGDSLDRYLPL